MGRKFTQAALFNVLLCGCYTGTATVRQVKNWGNLAVGTMHQLDGEVIMVDGELFQACADGQVHRPDDDATLPFATVADFAPEHAFTVSGVTGFEPFEAQAAKELPPSSEPVAIRLRGRFEFMKVRMVPRQERNGIGLAQVSDQEVRYEYTDVEGDLLGFRLPRYLEGVNVPGWHLHFIDAARKHGGHVMNFRLASGNVSYCTACDYTVHLPEDPAVLGGLDLDRDFAGDLTKAERTR